MYMYVCVDEFCHLIMTCRIFRTKPFVTNAASLITNKWKNAAVLFIYIYIYIYYIYMHIYITEYHLQSSSHIGSSTWWRNELETLSALLTICKGNPLIVVVSHHKSPCSALWCFLCVSFISVYMYWRFYTTPINSLWCLWRYMAAGGMDPGQHWFR